MAKSIELIKINKIYGDKIKTQVLFDIDLSFDEGTFTSIIGSSGSGKSTLLNIIGTLDRPSNGQIFVDGISTEKMNKNQLAELRNETIGFIFQFHHLLPEFTALENVLMPYVIKHGKASGEAVKRAEELMEMVGLSGVKKNLSSNMSGGQQQRTAIARALINNPKLILADEPTGNLDSESTENIYRILRNVNEAFRTTFIVITHDRRIAEKADRVVEIKDGRISMDIYK
ncbi:MAG TPA: ABC transporter ATP-binding protein [Pseudobacteroides sp.]|uniref:ABC transporter ATP-binding protein n=1 Tax=Pseudobacteroides sp. TaxID=1968840 RepID=UPI002F91D4B8